jgi:hypothetical protein
MFKKGISILIILFLLQLTVVSCFRKSQKCKGKLTYSTVTIANNLPYPTLTSFMDSTDKTIHYDSLTIQNNLYGEQFDCYYAQLKSTFVKSAYAFQPAEPQTTIVDRIDSTRFITLRDYNTTHMAGSDISDILYHTLGHTNHWTDMGIPTSQLVNDLNTQLSNPTIGASISHASRLSQKPTSSLDTVQFMFMYYLSNGKVLSDTTTEFVIVF